MRAVIHRVNSASVAVDGDLVTSIRKGLCVLLGVSRSDTQENINEIVDKVINLQLFNDQLGNEWKMNVKDVGYEILCISQFTLYSKLKGNVPEFHQALSADLSKNIYNDFVNTLKSAYDEGKIKDGFFGVHRHVKIEGDGPVTIIIDS